MSDAPDIRIDREVMIHAQPATVFRYFSDPEQFGAWFGQGSSIEARPGGAIDVHYPDGRFAIGEVLEVEPDARILFTWGYDREDSPMPPGSSRVEVTLTPVAEGTRVRLIHHVPTDEMRTAHSGGWRYYLAVLADCAARDEHSEGLTTRIDRYFAAWEEDRADVRSTLLAESLIDDCTFRDAFGLLHDRAEIEVHIARVQLFMPGATLTRDGDPVQNGDTVLCPWTTQSGSGHNVFRLAPDGRIREILGFPDAGESDSEATSGPDQETA